MAKNFINEIKSLGQSKQKPKSKRQSVINPIDLEDIEYLHKKALDTAFSDSKQSEYYKILNKRTFRKLPGYVDYKDIIVHFSNALNRFEEEISIRGGDRAYNALINASWWAVENPHFPVYAITRELMEVLLQMDLPNDIFQIKKIINEALFLLPDVIKSPDGDYFNWLFVSQRKIGETTIPPKYKNFIKEKCLSAGISDIKFEESLDHPRIRWISCVGKRFTYSSSLGLPIGTEIPEQKDLQFGFLYNDKSFGNFGEYNTDKDKELDITSKIDNLVFNLIMYMQYKEYKEKLDRINSVNQEIKTKLTGSRKTNYRLLDPIWIGKDYKIKVIENKPKSSSYPATHASPITHWRRGHFRRLKAVEGRREEKIIFIEPCLVNG